MKIPADDPSNSTFDDTASEHNSRPDEAQLRVQALAMAIDASSRARTETSEELAAIAATFLAFLKGEPTTP